MKEVYATAGASNAWELVRYNTGHPETADMRKRIMALLKRRF